MNTGLRDLGARVQRRLDEKTKPPGALGRIESLALQLALIQQREDPAWRAASSSRRACVAALVVTHGGWLNALRCVAPGCTRLAAADGPAPPPRGSLLRWRR